MLVRVGHFLCLLGVMFPAQTHRMQIQTCSGFLGLVNSSARITMMQGLAGATVLYCMSPLVIRSLASLHHDKMEAHRGVFIHIHVPGRQR